MKIDDIKIGERHREDLGDIDALAQSIEEIGLLHPPVVNQDTNELIAGYRRIKAYEKLGRKEIPVRKVSLDDITLGEYSENVVRKDFTPLEMDAIGRKIEPKLREMAEKREKAGPSGNFPEDEKGDVRDQVGDRLGISGKTYEKIKFVARSAEEEPEKYEETAQRMDEGELSIDKAYRKVKRQKNKEDRKKKKEEFPIPPEIDRGELPLNQVVCGEAIETLKKFPESSIHFCMFSPGYWGLRDYGMDDQIGLEDDYNEYITNLVNLCGELKRVLRDDGSLWIVIGDTYTTHASGSPKHSHNFKPAEIASEHGIGTMEKPDTDIPEKCKMLIPYRLALALIDDGWILRNDVTWVKQILFEDGTSFGAAMPSSVKDRLTTNTEVVFHFTQNQDYWYDLDAIRVPIKEKSKKRAEYPVAKFGGNPNAPRAKLGKGMKGGSETKIVKQNPRGKNPGDAWRISTAQSNEAHYAPYPEKLVERPLKASCPPKVCARCGSPYVRELEEVGKEEVKPIGTQGKQGDLQHDYETHRIIYEDKGWKPTCGCDAEIKPGIALDPMAGTGTTLATAKKFGRNFVGIDLNPDYVEMAQKRVEEIENG